MGHVPSSDSLNGPSGDPSRDPPSPPAGPQSPRAGPEPGVVQRSSSGVEEEFFNGCCSRYGTGIWIKLICFEDFTRILDVPQRGREGRRSGPGGGRPVQRCPPRRRPAQRRVLGGTRRGGGGVFLSFLFWSRMKSDLLCVWSRLSICH